MMTYRIKHWDGDINKYFVVFYELIRLSASWTFTMQKRNGFYTDFVSSKKTEYKTVALLNLKMTYIIKEFEINLSVSNLLNREYYDIGNVLQPGIWVVAGVKWQLKKCWSFTSIGCADFEIHRWVAVVQKLSQRKHFNESSELHEINVATLRRCVKNYYEQFFSIPHKKFS